MGYIGRPLKRIQLERMPDDIATPEIVPDQEAPRELAERGSQSAATPAKDAALIDASGALTPAR